MSFDEPNAIYYSNRANAFLELDQNTECINDCDQAINIDPKYVKSYYRKSKALANLDKL